MFSFQQNVCAMALSSLLPFEEALDFLIKLKSCIPVMLHVEDIFIAQMVIDATLAKYGKDPMMLTQKYISQFLLFLVLFLDLHRYDLLTILVYKSIMRMMRGKGWERGAADEKGINSFVDEFERIFFFHF